MSLYNTISDFSLIFMTNPLGANIVSLHGCKLSHHGCKLLYLCFLADFVAFLPDPFHESFSFNPY